MKKIASLVAVATLSMGSASAFAWTPCPVSHAELQAALNLAVQSPNGGFNLDMWGTVVNRDGAVCAVAKATNVNTGNSPADPWPASRVISAQKANTANSLSGINNTFSTGMLQGTGSSASSLVGLQFSNPVATNVGYRGDPAVYGTVTDPMNGLKVGGINIFGGGFALYNAGGNVVGGIGVSGDTSCADHSVGWRTREALATAVTGVEGSAATPNSDVIDVNYPACGVSGEAAGMIAASISGFVGTP